MRLYEGLEQPQQRRSITAVYDLLHIRVIRVLVHMLNLYFML